MKLYIGTKENSNDFDCLKMFYADNIEKAIQTAIEMKLKDFGELTNIKIKGEDY